MAADRPTFSYTFQEIAAVRKGLSNDRLSRYLILASGDITAAIRLYEKNTALSESLYGVLQGFEIVLRNSMHDTIAAWCRSPAWYDHVRLAAAERESVAKAKSKIVRKGKVETPLRVVAEMTFGFWSSLTARQYADRLWIPCLHRAFPNRRLGHREAFRRLDSIRFLRNQVAHHECILTRKPDQDYREIVEATEWICRDTAAWVRRTCRFEAVWHHLSSGAPKER